MIKEMNILDLEATNALLKDFLPISINEKSLQQKEIKRCIYMYDGEIVGYIEYAKLYERAELNQIYVMPHYRNQQIASSLMTYMIKECENNGVLSISLEVRVSNDIAIQLYEKFQFYKVAIRRNYYGSEDAILMVRGKC